MAFLSGLLLALSFPTFNLPWLAWLAPGLLLASGAGQSGRTVLCIGLSGGFGFYLASLHWLLRIPMPVHALAAWVGLSAYLAIFPAAWSWVCWRCFPRAKIADARAQAGRVNSAAGTGTVPPHPASRLTDAPHAPVRAFAFTACNPVSWSQRMRWHLNCGAAWVAMEMGLSHLFGGFPWNLLGASQYRCLPLIQLASVTGVYGISFLVAWTSASLFGAGLAAAETPHRFRSAARAILPSALAVVAVLACGSLQLSGTPPASSVLKVALIQPAVPQRVMWDPNERTNRLNLLLAISRNALTNHPDLLVWPEAALPGLLARTRATQEIVTGLVRDNQVWMVFGAEDSGYRKGPDGTQTLEHLNSAFLINPAGELAARYHKCHLVPFGEYMPGARRWPFLARLRQSGAGTAAGNGPVAFQTRSPRARFSTLICFEDVFPQLAREYVDPDTDFLLNLTNNGWFGAGAAQWQHAVSALFRAVENGLPLIRCTNNGLTCWIDACGRMHEVYFPASKDVYEAGYKIALIPLKAPGHARSPTIYRRFGDWFGWTCMTAVFVAVALSLRRHA